jgi:hypothetical protein
MTIKNRDMNPSIDYPLPPTCTKRGDALPHGLTRLCENSRPFEKPAAKRPAAKAAAAICADFSSLKAAAPSDLPAAESKRPLKQGLKPHPFLATISARLKSCPDTGLHKASCSAFPAEGLTFRSYPSAVHRCGRFLPVVPSPSFTSPAPQPAGQGAGSCLTCLSL